MSSWELDGGDGGNAQLDVISELSDLALTRHLIADLHDDLSGKLGRSRQLVDLKADLGASGTLLFGGEKTEAAWREAQWSFIHANFIATVLLCQSLVEHLLASYLYGGLMMDDLPPRPALSVTLRRCQERGVIGEREVEDVQRLMSIRNPLSHYRSIDDESGLTARVMTTMVDAHEHLFRDASFAVATAVRILALPAFRVGA